MALDYFTLLACTPEVPYRFNDHIELFPPTLDDIRRLGYGVYQGYTNILTANKFDLAEMLGLKADEIKGDTLVFITLLPFFREAYMAALSFFIRQNVHYDDDTGYSLEDGTFLSMDEIRELRKLILQFCYIEDKEDAGRLKYKNAKAKKIYERIQALKAEQAKSRKQKANPDMELSNLIGAVCAFSSGYTLINIWKLTIFQFYDQYIRLNTKVQMDISGVRWAAWGKEDFQWDLWHKAIKAHTHDQ